MYRTLKRRSVYSTLIGKPACIANSMVDQCIRDFVWYTNMHMTLAGRPPHIARTSVYLVCFKWKPGFRIILRLAIQPTERIFGIHLNTLEKEVYLLTLPTERKNFFKINWNMPRGLK